LAYESLKKGFVIPSKVLDNQIAAYKNGEKEFWPFNFACDAGTMPFQLKQAIDLNKTQALLHSISAKRSSDEMGKYYTIET
jgi:hypothetical protein